MSCFLLQKRKSCATGRKLRRLEPSDAPEHNAGDQTGATAVVVIVEAADDLAGGIEASDRRARGVLHLRIARDAQASESEGDASGNAVSMIGRDVEPAGPVALVDAKTAGAQPVVDVGIEWDVRAWRGVEGTNGLEEALRIDTGELWRQLLEGIGGFLGDARNPILFAQQADNLLVEHLPGEQARLFQDLAPILGVGVAVEVCALIDEALAAGVDDDTEWIVVLLKAVADRKITIGRRIDIPLHGVGTRPVAVRCRADLQGHAMAPTVVQSGTPHFDQVPIRSKISGTHLGVRFKTAAG